MNCPIFLIVRTASTRLPEKALTEIEGNPLIKILIDRISQAKIPDKIIVCTTSDKSDDRLVEFLIKNNIHVFRGNITNVLERLFQASKSFGVEKFVVVEGDDLFCDPSLIDKTAKILNEEKNEFVVWKNLPLGVSPIGFRTEGLKKLQKNNVGSKTDAGWGKLILDSGIVNVTYLEVENKLLKRPEIRLTVDYPEDLELAKKILKNLSSTSLVEIIKILDRNQDWLTINENAKKKYEQNFEKKIGISYGE